MNDKSGDSSLLMTMLKNFIDPAIRSLDDYFRDRMAKAIGRMTAAGVELDQMKDAPEKSIKRFFDSWTLQSDTKELISLLDYCECFAEIMLFMKPKLLTREFLALRDSIDKDELRVDLKCALDSMNIDKLRALLSDKPGDSEVEIRRRFFAKEVLEKIKYLYPGIHYPALFGSEITFDPFSFNDVFPLEILDKPYMLVLSQYGTCEATRFEKNLLRKLLSDQHREVIEQLYGNQIDLLCHIGGNYLIKHAEIRSLECNIKFLIDIYPNFQWCFSSVSSLINTDKDKIFEMLLRTVRADVDDKYEIFYYNDGVPIDSRVETLLAQLVIDTSKGLILDQVVYDNIYDYGLKKHYNICKKQIKWMKSILVFKSFTLMDALCCDVEDLAQFVDLKDNIQNLLAQCQEKKLIEYYYSPLEENLYTAIAVQDTRARATKLIQRATGLFVIEVIDKIMSYLSLKDLRFFALPVDPKI